MVGILHQAFEEYAHRLSREMREEWSKIQGLFVDLPVNTAADEQIGLLARAIESDHNPAEPTALSQVVATLTHRATSEDLPQLLEDCWPLHPVVSCLLGPISRRRFGQNQRSIFGFLIPRNPAGSRISCAALTTAISIQLTSSGITCASTWNPPSWLLRTATVGHWPWRLWNDARLWVVMNYSCCCSKP